MRFPPFFPFSVEVRRAAAAGDTDSALPSRCAHADVVVDAEKSREVEVPQADALFSKEGFELALAQVPAGTFNKGTVRAMRARVEQAAKEGVPVLVGLDKTKFYGVRDGNEFNRTVIGEWAHVECDESKQGSKMLQYKVGQASRSCCGFLSAWLWW